MLDVQSDESQADSTVVGASIMEIVAGGAAEQAGLQIGDIVTKFNGLPITGSTDLTAQVRALAAGATTAAHVRSRRRGHDGRGHARHARVVGSAGSRSGQLGSHP